MISYLSLVVVTVLVKVLAVPVLDAVDPPTGVVVPVDPDECAIAMLQVVLGIQQNTTKENKM